MRVYDPTDKTGPPKNNWWFCPRVPVEQWKAKWVQVKLFNGKVVEAHWACDLSGEEQPPFIGWFNRQYKEIHPEFWRQLPCPS